MKKFIAMFLLFGLVSVTTLAESKLGQESDVNCTKIFEGDSTKAPTVEGETAPVDPNSTES